MIIREQIKCPYCGGSQTFVRDTENFQSDDTVENCFECDRKFVILSKIKIEYQIATIEHQWDEGNNPDPGADDHIR